MRWTNCITQTMTETPKNFLTCDETCGKSSACISRSSSFGSLWFLSSAFAWSQYKPECQASRCSLLSICVLTPLSQLQFEFLLFSFLCPIFTYPSGDITSPLSRCLCICRRHIWALDSHRLGFEYPLCYLSVVELWPIHSHFLCHRILSVKQDNATSPYC